MAIPIGEDQEDLLPTNSRGDGETALFHSCVTRSVRLFSAFLSLRLR